MSFLGEPPLGTRWIRSLLPARPFLDRAAPSDMVASASKRTSAACTSTPASKFRRTSSSASVGSSPATPASTVFSGELHPYAEKLPKPVSTGNSLADSNAMGYYTQFQQLVDILLKDESHIAATFSALMKRIREANAQPDDKGSESFAKPPSSLGSLCSGEYESWAVHFATKYTGLKATEIVAAMRVDDGSLGQLLVAITGLSLTTRLPQCCGIKEICWDVLKWFAEALQARYSKLTKANFVKGDGSLNWAKGAYDIKLKTGKIVKIKHNFTECEIDVTHLNLDGSYQLLDNFSDTAAALVRRPLPPVKLQSLFDAKAKQGPHSIEVFTKLARPKAFAEKVDELHQAWLAKKEDAEGNSKDVSDEVEKELQCMHTERRTVVSQKGKEKVANVLAAKRQKRVIQLSTE